MSSTREQRAIFSNLSRKFESSIASRLGVRVYDAIPRKYRPESTELGYLLLSKLSQLADQVPDIASFKKHLSRACERRAENDPDSFEEPSIQPCDVVAAIKELEQVANSQLRTLLKKDRRSLPTVFKRDSLSLEKEDIKRRTKAQVKASKITRSRSASLGSPTTGKRKERSETPIQDRPRHPRTSKAAAGAKITAWTNLLKPTKQTSTGSLKRTASYVSDTSAVQTRASTVPDSEDDLPPSTVHIPLRRSFRRSGLTITDDMVRGTKRTRSPSAPQPQRRSSNRLRPAKESSSYKAPDDDVDSTEFSIAKSRRQRGVSTSVDPEGILATQKDHAALFPDNFTAKQHFKRANPNIIHNPLIVDDPDTLTYPVEVPAINRAGINRGKVAKRELWEIETAEDFREYQGEIAEIAEMLKQQPARPSKTPELTRESPIEDEPSMEFSETELQRQMLASNSAEHTDDVHEGIVQDDDSVHDGDSVRNEASIKTLLDAQIQLLANVMSDASTAAITATQGRTFLQRERAVRCAGVLADDFVKALKTAQAAYEDGLADLGVSLK